MVVMVVMVMVMMIMIVVPLFTLKLQELAQGKFCEKDDLGGLGGIGLPGQGDPVGGLQVVQWEVAGEGPAGFLISYQKEDLFGRDLGQGGKLFFPFFGDPGQGLPDRGDQAVLGQVLVFQPGQKLVFQVLQIVFHHFVLIQRICRSFGTGKVFYFLSYYTIGQAVLEGSMGKKQGIRVLASAIGVQFFSGTLYTWSIFKDQLVLAYGWTDAQGTLPYTVHTLTFSLAMFTAGLLLDKAGPRLMTSLGISLMGLGLIGAGMTSSVAGWAFFIGGFLSIGAGINNLVTTPAALAWFPPDQRGRITGYVVGGIAFAPLMYSPLVSWLFHKMGVSRGSLVLGLGLLTLPLLLAQGIKKPPAGYQPERGEEVIRGRGLELDFRQMARTPLFYKYYAMFALSSSAGLIVISHLTRIVRVQSGWEGGFLLIILMAFINALGRFMGGVLSDRLGQVQLLRATFILQMANMAFMGLYRTPVLLALGVSIAGFCYGSLLSIFPVMTADSFGVRHLGKNYGLMFTGWGIGGVFGPLMAGTIFDRTGSYQWAYVISMALLALAIGISLTLDREIEVPA